MREERERGLARSPPPHAKLKSSDLELRRQRSSRNHAKMVNSESSANNDAFIWTRPWRRVTKNKSGVWLCSCCERYLDRNTFGEEAEKLEVRHERLGIWPPFDRNFEVPLSQNKCDSCSRSLFCKCFNVI